MTFTEGVKNITESLRGTPALVVILLLNVIMLGAISWLVVEAGELRKEERSDMVRLLDRCLSDKGG